jgi:alpha-galactosidase
MLSAPLLIGCDMSQLDEFTLSLLTNDEVLALDQDPLGKEAVQVAEKDSVLVYAKELSDGTKAIGFFNVGSKTAGVTVALSELGLKGKQYVRDLWRQKDLGACSGSYHARGIPPHGVLLVKMSPKATGGQQ